MKLFEEKEAIEFIKSRVTTGRPSDDDILDVIDAIFDYYDQNGDLDLDFDDEEDDDESAITEYVIDELSDSDLSQQLIAEIVKAELAYEQSLL